MTFTWTRPICRFDGKRFISTCTPSGEKWLPLAKQAGLKRIGFVTAETGLGKLCVEDVAAMCADGGLGSRTFASMEAARKFVSEVPVSGP
jgi:hypothetical protein